ncbi:apoptosis inhibitor [Yokapox virus]|uniref:Apoptosis inhibitor n=1 Tax=Yokapox virus TaxID=1076255 RepID=G3EI97_9POXV|nr:apoptosis inhibitor [Yokapox virus]AEN03608.1 apoptosis inhibitor [Yokapox virus]
MIKDDKKYITNKIMTDSKITLDKIDLSNAIKYYINKRVLDSEYALLTSSSKEFLKVITKKCNKISTDYRLDICNYIDPNRISIDELVNEVVKNITINKNSIGIRLASISLVSNICSKWGQCVTTQELVCKMTDVIADSKQFTKYIKLYKYYNTKNNYIIGSILVIGGIIITFKVFNFL